MRTSSRSVVAAASAALLALVAQACGPRVTCLRFTDCDDGYTCGGGLCVPNATPVDPAADPGDASTEAGAKDASTTVARDASGAAIADAQEASVDAGDSASNDASSD